MRTATGRRRPDAGVECGPLDDDAYEAGEVRLVVEVLSPSTRDFDTFSKVDEYKAIDSMEQILLVEPNAPEVVLWSRAADRAWSQAKVSGLEASVEIASLSLTLQLGDIYSGLSFRPSPRLVD